VKTLIKLRHNNTTHLLLEQSVGYATAVGGNAAVVNQHAGEWWFLLDEGVTEVTLGIALSFEGQLTRTSRAVDAHGAPHAQEVVETWGHAWRVSDRYALRGGALHRIEADVPNGGSSLELRARRSVVAASRAEAAFGAGGVATFDVDLSFLESTSMLRPDAHAEVPWDDCDGCSVRLYQYTGTGSCSVVAVVIPPALRHGRPSRSLDSLIFFAPTSNPYRNTHDAKTDQLKRYLSHGGRHTGAQFSGFWKWPATVGEQIESQDYPPCRFAAQLRDSGRKVMLVMPQANGASYSPFTSSKWTASTGANSDALVASLIKAVQADGLLAGGRRARRVARGRVGVAGFSFGGAAALACFSNNRRRTHDLYLFDPNGLTQGSSHAQEIQTWVQSPDHRVRLIGGMHNRQQLAVASDWLTALGAAPLDASNDHSPGEAARDMSVVVLPTSSEFFVRSRDYAAAYAYPTGPLVTPAGASRQGALSRREAIHFAPHVADAPVQVTNARGATEAFPNFSSEEVALSLTFEYDAARAESPSRTPDFTATCHAVRRRSGAGIPLPDALRHQWTVFGGQSRGDHHDASFRGYLQICLETSGFAR
jgi:dienelactone hydrolase